MAALDAARPMRFAMKPATSFWTTMVSFPIERAKSSAAFSVSSEVCRPRMSSHRRIMGTGLKKWVPTTLSGLLVAAAMLVIDIAEVLVAVSYTHLRAHETRHDLVCRLLLEKKKKKKK